MSERPKFRFTLTDEEEEEIKNFFVKYDENNNGMLEVDELHQMILNFHIPATREEMTEVFEKVDVDHNGTVDYFELMEFIKEVVTESSTTEDVVEAFTLIDEDKNGVLSMEEMALAMKKADVGIPQDDIVYLMSEANINKDDTISFSQFASLMLGV